MTEQGGPIWDVQLTPRARKSLKQLDPQVARRIGSALQRLAQNDDPANSCKALSGPMTGLWRYRVGDYRVICDIQAGRLVILALDVGHRSSIY